MSVARSRKASSPYTAIEFATGTCDEQLLELTSEPECYDIEVSEDSADPGGRAPQYLVETTTTKFESLCTDSVAIIDFGEFVNVDAPRQTTGIPNMHAAPDIFLSATASLGSDIWSLACTICELRADFNPFTGFSDFSLPETFNVIRGWEFYA
ncbi:hypothetical protein DL770_003953 [Monosporascus sp. CRB-9-2]|nr:hypothetical protein DL770_003953 [Monosporascus sp. CRB-9-2]